MIFNHKSIRIQALSTGGQYTSFQLPNQKVSIDMGLASERSIRCNRVFITHPHIDHAAGIIRHCSTREMIGLPPPIYYIGEEHRSAFDEMLAAWRRLNRSFMPCKVETIKPNQKVELENNYFIKAFRSIHRIPCLGYMLYEKRRKLSPEFSSCSGKELASLRKNNVDIHIHSSIPLFAYTGDTTIDVMEREDDLQKCSFLAIETTFFDDRVSVKKARAHGHIHIEEVAQKAHLFLNDKILLMHLSARHSLQEAEQAIERLLSEELQARITILPNLSPFKALENHFKSLSQPS
jgi:ribonuclease Z